MKIEFILLIYFMLRFQGFLQNFIIAPDHHAGVLYHARSREGILVNLLNCQFQERIIRILLFASGYLHEDGMTGIDFQRLIVI